ERAAVRTAFPHPRKHLCWQAAVRSLDHGCESRSDPRSLPPARPGTQGGDPMDLVLVVCGAGASSTFLASRMRMLATERGLDITARAASNLDLASHLPDARVLLVGPHLESSFAE